jgi:hypothetical protein
MLEGADTSVSSPAEAKDALKQGAPLPPQPAVGVPVVAYGALLFVFY